VTASAVAKVRNWPALPAKWSRGLRRRARHWWRLGTGHDAAAIERCVVEFAVECERLAPFADAVRRERWIRVLAQFGERNVAMTLSSSAQRLDLSPEHSLTRLDARCAAMEQLLTRVRATFDRDLQSLPKTVNADDARSAALFAWASQLPPGATLLDVGCGTGRFLHLLAERFPTLRLTGLDPAAQSLNSLRAGVQRLVGGALCLPIADGAFDAVIAIESLEHSLRPTLAMQELLRVLKPGGRLLVIDKNRRLQASCEHEVWERWFDLNEVSDWIATAATVERSEFLPADGEHVPPELFCLWTATKRGSA
jgi:ubiquinone/menaquinone biosynthesis C-methylase UbiE